MPHETRHRTLALTSSRPYSQAAIDHMNRARYAQATARQLAKLERALAAEQPDPHWRRCEVCDGREWSGQPHPHAA